MVKIDNELRAALETFLRAADTKAKKEMLNGMRMAVEPDCRVFSDEIKCTSGNLPVFTIYGQVKSRTKK